jgi:hypothetical protein
MSEIDEFERGQAASFDPQPVGLAVEESGEAVTSGTSRWHTRICTTCGHTFRRGDRVLVDPVTREVRHLDPELRCAVADAPDAAEPGTDVREFSAGLLAAWPVAGDVPVVRSDDLPELLDPPVAGFRRSCCLFCAHTFRPGEMVIVCPCRPLERRCVRAVHRDPARGLVCWESWRPDARIAVCPVMLTRMAP